MAQYCRATGTKGESCSLRKGGEDLSLQCAAELTFTPRGFTTEVSVWIPLEGEDDFDIVYVGPEVYDDPSVTCPAPCMLVFPTSALSDTTTISPAAYTTSVEYGRLATTSISGRIVTTFVTTTTTITVTIDPITTDAMQYSNINITQGQTSDHITVLPSIEIPPIPWPLPDGEGSTTTRTLYLPPWPDVEKGPPDGDGWSNPPGHSGGPQEGVFRTPFVTTITATAATVTTVLFPPTVSPMTIACPPNSEIQFNTPRTVMTTRCPDFTSWVIHFTCPPSRVVTLLGSSTAVVTADCTLSTSFTPPGGGGDGEETSTTSTSNPVSHFYWDKRCKIRPRNNPASNAPVLRLTHSLQPRRRYPCGARGHRVRLRRLRMRKTTTTTTSLWLDSYHLAGFGSFR